jgi:hypothetical protein
MDRFPIGSTVNLDFTIISAGAGVTGETPSIAVQRVTDGFWHDSLQPTGSQFAASFNTDAMVEVDAANLPGLYRFALDHSEDLTASELFFVRLINTGANAQVEDKTIAFGPFRSAAALSTCNLFGTLLDIDGQADFNKPVRLSILPNTVLTTGAKEGISVDRIDTFTDNTGQFGVDLIRGLVVRLQIPSIGYDRKITIPNAASANFADL